MAKEEAELQAMAEKFHAEKVNVVLCQREIDDLVKYHFAKLGILALEKVNKTDMEAVASASGATIINNVKDLNTDALGSFNLAEQETLGELPILKLSNGVNAAHYCARRGPTTHFVDEMKGHLTMQQVLLALHSPILLSLRVVGSPMQAYPTILQPMQRLYQAVKVWQSLLWRRHLRQFHFGRKRRA